MSRIISRLFSDKNYAILLTTVFVIAGAISASHHEMWRDELQAWLIARDSSSIIDLFRNLKYEGHPGLWHLCLMPLARITWSPIIMQVFHLMIAGASIYVFTRYSPFTRFQKALFAFGYFPFYEYSILCRNYALGVLLLFIFCALHEKRFAKFPLIACVLFLLAHTSVHCLIITMAIGLGLFVEYLFERKKLPKETKRKLYVYLGFLIIALGIVTSVMQLRPPEDTGFAVTWVTKYDVKRIRDVFNILERAFVPIPKFNLHFWNSNILDSLPKSSGIWGALLIPARVKSILSGIIVLWALLVLLKKRIALLIYVSGTIGLYTFFYIKYFGSMRHHGFLFILFIVSAWISHYCSRVPGCEEKARPGSISRWYINIPLSLILVAHVVGGFAATGMDYIYAFSQGKAVARYVKESGMEDMMIVGEIDYTASTIAGYLENRIYYVRGDRLGSFVIWDKIRTGNITSEDVLKKARELADLKKQNILIILNSPLKKEALSQYSLTEIAKFEEAVVANEIYYLYSMNGMINRLPRKSSTLSLAPAPQ